MSSCGNSSNIKGNTIFNTFNNVGSRIIVPIDWTGFSGGAGADYGWRDSNDISGAAGATQGDAIFFDVRTGSVSEGKFIPAIANSAETAEVFGIIESIDGGVAAVVISGQINYPMSRIHLDSRSVSGASGGNDVFFLSNATAGLLSNLAPQELTHIAKPLMTGATLGSFNAIVNNYIGYAIGGAVSGTETGGSPAGTLRYLPENIINTLATNSTWSDARTSYTVVNESRYDDLKSLYSDGDGIPKYGFLVEAEPETGYNTNNSHTKKAVTQGTKNATVSFIENGKWYFEVPAGGGLIADGTVKINGENFKVKNTKISHFKTLSFPEETVRAKRSDGTSETLIMVPIIKLTGEQGINIPSTMYIGKVYAEELLSATSIDCSGSIVGPYDVACKISDFETRISSLESKVHGS